MTFLCLLKISAMGMLSLYNMVYLAETRGEYLKQLLEPGLQKAGREGGERDYPWATAAINVTALIMKLLNVSDGDNNSLFLLFKCHLYID